MSNNISGNEPFYPVEEERLNDNYIGKQLQPKLGIGITLKQEALLRFMCEIIKFKNPNDNHNPILVAEIAEDYTNAYIEQLNK